MVTAAAAVLIWSFGTYRPGNRGVGPARRGPGAAAAAPPATAVALSERGIAVGDCPA
jgi:hypothetical protein